MKHIKETKGRTLISDAEIRTPLVRLAYWLLIALLGIGTLVAVIPFFWLFVGGVKTPQEVSGIALTLLPRGSLVEWNWGNYIMAFQKFNFSKYFVNTMILILGVWFFQITSSSLAGYALAKLRVPYPRLVLILFLATLMVPFETIMIPLYLTVKDPPLTKAALRILLGPEWIENLQFLSDYMRRGLLDTYWGVILPSSVSAFGIFLFRGFFQSIPDDLIEAARIDGCSELGIFGRVVVPLSMPIFAVITIFSALGTWNSFVWPYLVLDQQDKFPIMVRLFFLFEHSETTYNILLATLFLCSVPPILLFFLFQKQIVRGITLTGLKA